MQATLKAWRDASTAAYRSMEEEVEKRHRDPEDLRAAFRLLGEGDRNTLVRGLMTAIAEKFLRKGNERDEFWSPDPDYPN